MTSTKRSNVAVDSDVDDDFDEDSGSDFDDDEDPDKIEVPGGGRDLQTAVTYAKNSSIQKQAQTNNNSLLISNQPGTVAPTKINNNMPKKSTNSSPVGMSAAYPSSSNSTGAAAGVGATAAGFAQLGMIPFNTSQLMSMAALAAAGGLPPTFNTTSSSSATTTANSFISGGFGSNLNSGLANISANSTSSSSYYQASSNFNMAASLLAQSKSSNVGNNQNFCFVFNL